ncbi:MAG TPA: hypothetical protein PKD64_12220 [Pirellulaceae bacterium]|nr:hypothetical protein [Pirellulaceae bacterium]HMO92952.1 hypothetical protein [Pirellulaceae bacterium]HMP68483.1 hypothetical protein [Pirellulaceae bacterium]
MSTTIVRRAGTAIVPVAVMPIMTATAIMPVAVMRMMTATATSAMTMVMMNATQH